MCAGVADFLIVARLRRRKQISMRHPHPSSTPSFLRSSRGLSKVRNGSRLC